MKPFTSTAIAAGTLRTATAGCEPSMNVSIASHNQSVNATYLAISGPVPPRMRRMAVKSSTGACRERLVDGTSHPGGAHGFRSGTTALDEPDALRPQYEPGTILLDRYGLFVQFPWDRVDAIMAWMADRGIATEEHPESGCVLQGPRRDVAPSRGVSRLLPRPISRMDSRTSDARG